MTLSDQHSKMFSVFMQAPVSVSVLEGPEHVFVFSNPAHQKIFQRPLIGKKFAKAFDRNNEIALELLDQVYSTGETAVLKEVRVENYFLDLSFTALRDSEGKITGIVSFTVDTTQSVLDRKKVELLTHAKDIQYREFDTLLAGVPDPLILFDLKGRYKYCNRAALRSFALTMEEILGKPFREVNTSITPESIAIFEAHLETIKRTGEAIIDEFSVITPDGRRNFEYCLDGVRNQKGILEGFSTASRDITDRSEYQIGRNTIIEQLNEERDLREAFVGTLTHDMRTPLTAIKMLADLIDRKLTDTDFLHKASQKISVQILRLDKMIRDLLDANLIKAGKGISLFLENHDMEMIIESTLSGLSLIHGTRFKFESTAVQGIWDADGVQRIIENLIGNAVKYGKQQAPITVRLKQIKDSIEIEVHNEGNPISGADQENLFKQYRRTNSAQAGNQTGWGIGLSLVKGVVEAHGGNVSVKSSEEEGTSFFVRMPLMTELA